MIIVGDSQEKLKELGSDSVDMIFTDPPYGISFMGKQWDRALPNPETWKQCLRVLKPGCFAFIMSGTRADCLWRIMRDIEEAGFKIGFTINIWLYKCLSDDTQIYTKNGWKTIYEIKDQEEILCYEPDTGKFVFDKPIEWNVYKIKDTCYRIVSDNTDQIVTGKHNVIIEREGKLLCEFAERLSAEENISILEFMPNLSNTNIFKEEKEDLFNTMQTNILDKICCSENSQAEQKNNNDEMSGLWENVSSFELSFKERAGEILFETMQWEDESNTSPRIQQEKPNKAHRENKTKISRTVDGRQESFLEGWNNIFQEKGQLQKHQIYQMSNGIQGNEQERWICDGTQAYCSKKNRKNVEEDGNSSSYRSRSDEQRHFKPDVICNQFRPQEIRKWAGYKTTLASIEKVLYEGNVFCPTTNTGFFIARRNGKTFVTGNSGFPKAMNIGKKIDQKLGYERKQGEKLYSRGSHENSQWQGGRYKKEDVFDMSVPLSPLACKMEGSFGGYQPKPAGEVVICAMKPLTESGYLAQAMKDGKGVSWLDDVRVPFEDEGDKNYGCHSSRDNRSPFTTGDSELNNMAYDRTNGRFPANILVSNEAIEAHKYFSLDRWFEGQVLDIPKASKREKNEGCEAILPNKKTVHYGIERLNTLNKQNNSHPTCKPIKLPAYFITLGTRPGDVVLDPFAGSGSTGVAAVSLGRRFIGIELCPEYAEIAKARIRSVQDKYALFKEEA